MNSPDYLRISLAAAMELGFVQGFFYRQARLHCINLLLTYEDGCKGNCAFCGLSRERSGLYPEKKFIRVEWPTKPTDEIIERLQNVQNGDVVQRVCLSMITHKRAVADSLTLIKRLNKSLDLPLSALITPTIMTADDIKALKDAGTERVGVAIDCATGHLFDEHRGRMVKGPHDWDRYWEVYEQAMGIFGQGMVGVHLICGIGETEKELVLAIQKARDLGGSTHLFSFFPEAGSGLAETLPPEISVYRRIQLARYMIDKDLAQEANFEYDDQERIVDFGVPDEILNIVINQGNCFMTSGCPGETMEAACNRPFANERPGPEIRNYPFQPNDEDIDLARGQIWADMRGEAE